MDAVARKDCGSCNIKERSACHAYLSKDDGAAAEKSTRAFFYTGFALVILNRIVDQTAANLALEFISGLPLMPIAFALLLIRYVGVLLGVEVKRAALVSFLLLLSFISSFKCGQSYLPTACLLLCGIGEINVRQVIKVASSCILTLIVFLGLLQVMEWMTTGDLAGSVTRAGGRVRLSFFFTHPNTLGAMACMSFIGLTASQDRFRASSALLGLVVGLLVVIITDSRTSAARLYAYLLLRLLFEARPGWLNFKAVLGFALVPLLFETIAAVVMLQLLPDSVYSSLNVLFNGRPGYWVLQYTQLGGWTFLGQETLYGNQFINGWLYPSVTIDCFYAASLLQVGAWSFLAYYYLYLRSGYRAAACCDAFKFSALLVCAVFGFTEIHMIDFAICTPMLLLGEGLLRCGIPSKNTCRKRVSAECSRSNRLASVDLQ